MAQISNFEAVAWRWRVNETDQRLHLVLATDIEFPTQFDLAALLQFNPQGQTFTAQDAEIYSQYREQFKSLPLDEEGKFTLAINATVARQYSKPLATKSWYFMQGNADATALKLSSGDYICAQAYGLGLYLVLDTDPSASTLMLMSKEHAIDPQRRFQRGKLVRVHNDRLIPHSGPILEQDL